MLITADIEEKNINNKLLLSRLQLTIESGEKVAIIGRNGVGKTTLFKMLTREDTDFAGTISSKQGVRIVSTRQEHHDVANNTVVSYVLNNLPEYARLSEIIETYPDSMGENMRKIEIYSDALERFSQLEYHDAQQRVERSLEAYQLDPTMLMGVLSGGQKRLVELVRVEHSAADLALIDEPTNHMDYVAKAAFIEWFTSVNHAVAVITHDRDVLQATSRIIEIKDMAATSYVGNYDAYIKQNAARTANELHEYEINQRRMMNIKKQLQYARSKKSSWSGTADKKNPFVVMETRLLKELGELSANEKPSFWIDQMSAADLRPNVAENYSKHKAKTIRIPRFSQAERQRDLVQLDNVSVGYNHTLFEPITRRILTGDRAQLVGRNGAGKTTLIKTILDIAAGNRPKTLLQGNIKTDIKLRVNTYDQEIASALLDLTLAQAIEHLYAQYGLQITNEQIMRLLADFLFDPYLDQEHLVRNLSGGQKARLQLMKLFANDPNLIVLDEPTNHLDLPSIEELEICLASYKGAILYISHDSYTAQHLGGDVISVYSRT